MNNIVAIVGKPNVGKSSLFNKLIGKRKSIVHHQAGVTRDRVYADINWSGKNFKIIDTGGIEVENRPFQEQIKLQVEIAIEEASVIILVIDGKAGMTSDDNLIIKILRKTKKHIIVVANKLEGNKEMDTDIWTIGLGSIYGISALHGEGVGDMLDEVVNSLPIDVNHNENLKKLTIIGRQNAGKSSLLNALLNDERAIVSEVAGTTRDAINAEIKISDHFYSIIDTAGINRKSKLLASVDHYALSRAMDSINDADIVLLVIDYERDISHFDSVVGGYAFERKKPIAIIINKWDLAKKKTMTMKIKEKDVKTHFKFLKWAPVIFISAKTKLRLEKLKEQILEIDNNTQKKIKTSVLNEVMNEIQIIQPAQTNNGGRLNIKFIRQIDARIPTFIFWVNNKKYLHFTYERFLENKLREYFGFEGTPLQLLFRSQKGVEYGFGK